MEWKSNQMYWNTIIVNKLWMTTGQDQKKRKEETERKQREKKTGGEEIKDSTQWSSELVTKYGSNK